MPRPELALLDEQQLDRPGRPAGREPARDLQESANDRLALVGSGRSIDDGEDVEVARRSKLAADGRAVEVGADQRPAEGLAEDLDDLFAEAIVVAALDSTGRAGGSPGARRLSDGCRPRWRGG
jgi:hypothetical protein